MEMLDESLVMLIQDEVGMKKNYTFMDLYRCVDKLVDLMTEDAGKDEDK